MTLNKSLLIVRPALNLFESFEEFVEEMRAQNQPLWAPYLPQEAESPQAFITRLCRRETAPEPPFVPETIYWPTVGGHVVGRISLRHYLDGNLTRVGGHIGYEVRPSFRRQGLATEMLRQVLQTTKAREIGKLLLTCAPENEASNKTILKNGGVLTQKIYVEMVSGYRNHYWIDPIALVDLKKHLHEKRSK